MKSILRVVSILSLLPLLCSHAGEKRQQQLAEIEAIKAELKPLREKAYSEPEVVAAKKSLDAAYAAYWETVRQAMERLDPSKKKLIEKEVALRKQLNPVRSGKPDEAKPAASPATKAAASPAQ
jgi:predicted  nucleic acid-binding Zn-ribbon protein